MGVSKNRVYPKMDGENNGKPYEQMDDLGVPLFLEAPIFQTMFGGRVQSRLFIPAGWISGAKHLPKGA